MKIERMQIHSFSDDFAAVVVLGTYGPYFHKMHCTIPLAST